MLHTPKDQGTTALFKHPVLEKLARTHVSVPLTIYVVGSAILMYINFSRGYSTPLQGIGLFAIGLFVWTFVEYIMHKHLFHMLPTNKIKERVQYTFHGIHHDYPRDKTRLAMPPAASLIILIVLFFAFKFFMSNNVYAFFPGFVMGYSAYLGVHYAIHAFPPPKNRFSALWINHSIHHYKDDHVAFGVSSVLWDVIFGTVPKKTYKRNSPIKQAEKHPEQAHAEAMA